MGSSVLLQAQMKAERITMVMTVRIGWLWQRDGRDRKRKAAKEWTADIQIAGAERPMAGNGKDCNRSSVVASWQPDL